VTTAAFIVNFLQHQKPVPFSTVEQCTPSMIGAAAVGT
jgi:hypothetical protein